MGYKWFSSTVLVLLVTTKSRRSGPHTCYRGITLQVVSTPEGKGPHSSEQARHRRAHITPRVIQLHKGDITDFFRSD